MKTPIQEAIEKVQSLRQIDAVINPIGVIESILSSMLEKEKKVMCEFQDKAQYTDFWVKYDGADDCFEQTFNTKER